MEEGPKIWKGGVLMEYPKQPADEEWDHLKAVAEKYDLFLVQLSERRWQVFERRYIRVKSNIIVPYLRPADDAKHNWSGGLQEIERRLLKKYGEATKV